MFKEKIKGQECVVFTVEEYEALLDKINTLETFFNSIRNGGEKCVQE